MALVGSAGLLSILSVIVICVGAHDEPYGVFRYGDAVVQLLVATGLMTLWAVWLVGTAAGALMHRLHPLYWLLIVWGALCIFYLLSCPAGYLGDIEHLMIPGGPAPN